MSDNNLYAVIWILVFALLGAALFKGCESDRARQQSDALTAEQERQVKAFAQSDCTRKGGTMYGEQCVICAGASK